MELCKDCYYSKQAGTSKGCCADDLVPDYNCPSGGVYLEPYKDKETGKLFAIEELRHIRS